MSKQFLKAAFGWGIGLWLVGYVLGIVLFPIVPNPLLGWVIMPAGTFLTLWVLFKKIKLNSPGEYFILSVIWILVAVILDYFLLVQLFRPKDGYYKPDVYLYYLLTFLLPLGVYWYRARNKGI